MCKILPKTQGENDLATCYNAYFSFPVIYTINNIKAKKKVLWIHGESSYYKALVVRYKNYYKMYEYIFGVYIECINDFIKMFPENKGKRSIFYNRIYYKDIERLGTEYNKLDKELME